MKANDLMVGDLIQVKRGFNGYLTNEKIKGLIDDDTIFYPITLATEERVSLNDVVPIELTEEILVKNGWRKESTTIDGDYANWHGEIPICQEEDEFNYERIEITYVHQLQHFLLLCGIEKEVEL